VVSVLIEYFLQKHPVQLKEKLRDKHLILKMMDELDIAALLDDGGIKI